MWGFHCAEAAKAYLDFYYTVVPFHKGTKDTTRGDLRIIKCN